MCWLTYWNMNRRTRRALHTQTWAQSSTAWRAQRTWRVSYRQYRAGTVYCHPALLQQYSLRSSTLEYSVVQWRGQGVLQDLYRWQALQTCGIMQGLLPHQWLLCWQRSVSSVGFNVSSRRFTRGTIMISTHAETHQAHIRHTSALQPPLIQHMSDTHAHCDILAASMLLQARLPLEHMSATHAPSVSPGCKCCINTPCCCDVPAGQAYRTVRRSFPRATVIGWVSGSDGSLHLNSRDSTIVQPGSQLVFVARGVDDTLVSLPAPYEVCIVQSDAIA
jgi:hypothetical protein